MDRWKALSISSFGLALCIAAISDPWAACAMLPIAFFNTCVVVCSG